VNPLPPPEVIQPHPRDPTNPLQMSMVLLHQTAMVPHPRGHTNPHQMSMDPHLQTAMVPHPGVGQAGSVWELQKGLNALLNGAAAPAPAQAAPVDTTTVDTIKVPPTNDTCHNLVRNV